MPRSSSDFFHEFEPPGMFLQKKGGHMVRM